MSGETYTFGIFIARQTDVPPEDLRARCESAPARIGEKIPTPPGVSRYVRRYVDQPAGEAADEARFLDRAKTRFVTVAKCGSAL